MASTTKAGLVADRGTGALHKKPAVNKPLGTKPPPPRPNDDLLFVPTGH